MDLTPAAAAATTEPPPWRRAARSAHGNARGRRWEAGSGAPRRNRPPCASDTPRRCCSSAPACAAPAALTVVRPRGLPGAGAARSLRARLCVADIARLRGEVERTPPPRRWYLSTCNRKRKQTTHEIPRTYQKQIFKKSLTKPMIPCCAWSLAVDRAPRALRQETYAAKRSGGMTEKAAACRLGGPPPLRRFPVSSSPRRISQYTALCSLLSGARKNLYPCRAS